MFFTEYINILKKNFKRSISNEEICGILFDAIIEPANIKNRNGEMLTIEKAEISRILKQKKNIPTALQDHIYDKDVLDNISNYFETQIATELVPDNFDLCHQMLKLIDSDEDISPEHKATLRILANPKTIAPFLAEVFIYVIRQTNKIPNASNALNPPSEEQQPVLQLLGINSDDDLTPEVEFSRFHPKNKFSVIEYQTHIRELFEEISSLQGLRINNKSIRQRHPELFAYEYLQNLGELVEISETEQLMIETLAEELNLTLPKDFFDIGELHHSHPFGMEPSISGDSIGKLKYEKIQSLLKEIDNYRQLEPIDDAFQYIYQIRLALRNCGKTFDEDILVRLFIPKNVILVDEDLENYFSKYFWLDIFDNFSDIFNIERSQNYFRYTNLNNSDINFELNFKLKQLRRLELFPKDKRNLIEEWNDLFPYFITVNNDNIILEVEFEEINQHTAIAFPTVLLMKKYISSIRYEIRSKFSPEVFTSELKLMEKI